ncbi:magnesium transporter [Shewanella gelidii]|uniref:Magnesium transporter n=1 Tax=Shewanella gelidii TaxID=1642821 RepID=A0A917N6W5_9GAMM|nr:magnesium transporter [Shewanella gelidii]MCL1097036.1 magnesium transporter [Shewanella gelidii]GGI72064.1 magnesium transporter [Shewanella gelidii]
MIINDNMHTQTELLSRVMAVFSTDDFTDTAALAFIVESSDADIAHLIESVNEQYRYAIWNETPCERYWSILHLLHYETAKHVIGFLSQPQLRSLLAEANEKDIITYAEALPADSVEDFLEQLETQATEQLQQALSYQDEEVGRYTNYNIIKSRPSTTAGRIVGRMAAKPDIQYNGIYVTSVQKEFLGYCTIEQVLRCAPDTPLADLMVMLDVVDHQVDMTTAAQSVNPIEGVAWVPVQKDGQIIGAIATSLLMQRLKEKSLEILASDTAQNEEDLFTPVPIAAKMRAIWLTANLLTAFLASWVIGWFGDALQQVVALAILMPVVASMGGIAGSQTLAVSLRGMALNHLSRSNLNLLLDKEIKIAALNGLLLGLVISVVVSWWFDSSVLGGIIFVAIVCNSLAAASSGTLIPFILKHLNIDPAVAGSVILTTVTDIVGFLIFLGLGSLLLMQ